MSELKLLEDKYTKDTILRLDKEKLQMRLDEILRSLKGSVKILQSDSDFDLGHDSEK